MIRTRVLSLFVLPHYDAERIHLRTILKALSFGDWLVLYLVARNIDRY